MRPRPGAVARVTGRLQANPRLLTETPWRREDFVQGNEAVAMLARAMPAPPAEEGLVVSTVTTVTSDPRVMPPGSPRRDPLVVVQEQTVGQETREEAIGDGGAGFRSGYRRRYDAEGRRETLRGLRVGERVGKMRKFPPLGSDAVTCGRRAGNRRDANRRAGPFDPTRDRYDRYDDRYDGAAPDAPWVVGLDAEWRPHKHCRWRCCRWRRAMKRSWTWRR